VDVPYLTKIPYALVVQQCSWTLWKVYILSLSNIKPVNAQLT
jgi:hypothetical protein